MPSEYAASPWQMAGNEMKRLFIPAKSIQKIKNRVDK